MGLTPLPQLKTPEVEGVLDQYQKGLGVKALIDQQRLRGQQIQQNDQQMTAWQQDQRKQQAIQQAIEAAGGDTEQAIPEIMKIDPKVGNEYREGFSKWRKSSDDEKISHLDLMQKQAEQVANIVSGVKPGDQQGWLSAVDTAHKQGLIDDDKYQVYASMPPDPAVLQGIQKAAMTVPQRLQAEKDKIAADRQAKIDKQTFEHNKKMEASAKERDFQADYERQIASGNLTRNVKNEINYKDKWEKDQAEGRRSEVSVTNEDATAIADAIISGDQPPVLTGLYRNAGPVRAELARKGFDLSTATRDWTAIQRHLSTLNGAQQERLRQAVTFTSDSLPIIENLYDEWLKVGPASGVKLFNKAGLKAAKQLPGKAGEVATNLEAQINDLTAELGTVYKGGNASTDESLRLAAENLKAEWNEQTFKRAIGQIKKNLAIRRNSIMTSEAAGVSPNSPYSPPKEEVAPTNSPSNEQPVYQGGKLIGYTQDGKTMRLP